MTDTRIQGEQATMDHCDSERPPATGRWPLVGRSAELDLIRRALQSRHVGGVVVAGGAGTGRSRLTAEAVRDLDAGTYAVARVAGTRSGTKIPFSAFTHWLPSRAWTKDRMTTAMRELTDALGPEPGQGRTVLVVDDAHLLDQASAALVHHLALRRTVRLAVTLRDGASSPDAVTALWKDDLLRRLELAPLSQHELAEVLAGALGGHVESRTVRRLSLITQGDLRLLGELVAAGRATGALARRQGVWGWQGALPMTGRVRELIRNRIGDFDDEEQEVLAYVAFGEPLPAETLAALVRAVAVERLERRALIKTRLVDRRLVVDLAAPLHGEVVRALTGPLRERRVKRRLADAFEAADPPSGDGLRLAEWRLSGGGPADPAVLAEGCRLALAAFDIPLAERLARAALQAGAPLDAAPAVMTAYGLALEIPDRINSGSAQARHATARAYGLALGGRPGGEVRRALDEAAAAVTEPESRQELLGAGALLAACGALRGTGAQRDPGAGMPSPSSPLASARLAAAEATALADEGQSGRSLDRVEFALAAAPAWHGQDPMLVLCLEIARATACVFAGDLPRATERIIGEDTGWETSAAALCGLRARLCRIRGELRDALAWSRDGIRRLPDGPAAFAGLCFGELAHACALTGDVATARHALTAARDRTLPVFRTVDFAAELATPWVMAAQGDRRAAVRAALATAEAAEGHGLRGHQMFALHDAVRLGAAAQVTDRLRNLCDRLDGALAPVLAQHGAACAASDGGTLDLVAKQFETFGMLLYAAEAQAQAAHAYAQAGDQRHARAAATRGWTLARAGHGARTPALSDLAAPDLTARQREIAQLAASGHSNRQIAERLTVSIRTVANHLCCVYDRLGVHDRGELARLLAGSVPEQGS